MFTAVHQMPVVETCSPPGLACHVETYGMDDVQPAAGRCGGSADVSRVVGNLGMNQDDIEWWQGHVRSLACGSCPFGSGGIAGTLRAVNDSDRSLMTTFYRHVPAGCVALLSIGLVITGFLDLLGTMDKSSLVVLVVAGSLGILGVFFAWAGHRLNASLIWFAGVLSVMLVVQGFISSNTQWTAMGILGLVVTLCVCAICPSFRESQSSTDRTDPRSLKLLELIYSQTMLSDTARRVLYRERELSLLRRTIEEDIQKGDFNAALVLCQDMEKLFGYTEEADEARERVLEIRNAKQAQQIEEKISGVHRMLERGSWRKAELAATRLHRLYPNSPKLQELEQSIRIALEDRKRLLHSEYVSSIASSDTERSMGILRELDRYLSPEEAEAIRKSAQEVINDHRELLSTRFRDAVSAHRWQEAIQAGEQIMMEYPMDTMATEVGEMMERLHERQQAMNTRPSE